MTKHEVVEYFMLLFYRWFFRYKQNYIGKLNQKVNFIMIKAEGGSMKSSMIVEILSKKYVFDQSHFALSLICFKLWKRVQQNDINLLNPFAYGGGNNWIFFFFKKSNFRNGSERLPQRNLSQRTLRPASMNFLLSDPSNHSENNSPNKGSLYIPAVFAFNATNISSMRIFALINLIRRGEFFLRLNFGKTKSRFGGCEI